MPIVRNTTQNLRRKVECYEDPYTHSLQPTEISRCRECRSMYIDKRWVLESQVPDQTARDASIPETLCPACQKIRDRMPGGIVNLTGGFVSNHEDEIMNLLRHQNQEAMQINPVERIMDIERTESGIAVQTTNEKLAQRIGRAMHKAYDGSVEYKWSKGTKLARVNWRRDE